MKFKLEALTVWNFDKKTAGYYKGNGHHLHPRVAKKTPIIKKALMSGNYKSTKEIARITGASIDMVNKCKRKFGAVLNG